MVIPKIVSCKTAVKKDIQKTFDAFMNIYNEFESSEKTTSTSRLKLFDRFKDIEMSYSKLSKLKALNKHVNQFQYRNNSYETEPYLFCKQTFLKNFPIKIKALKRMNAYLLSQVDDNEEAFKYKITDESTYRSVNIHASFFIDEVRHTSWYKHEFIPPSHIKESMDIWVSSLNDDLKTSKNPLKIIKKFVRMTWYFSEFVSIHPFKNGNGRTAYMVLQFLLEKENLPRFPIEYDDKRYLSAMHEASENKNPLPLLSYFADRLNNSLYHTLKKSEKPEDQGSEFKVKNIYREDIKGNQISFNEMKNMFIDTLKSQMIKDQACQKNNKSKATQTQNKGSHLEMPKRSRLYYTHDGAVNYDAYNDLKNRFKNECKICMNGHEKMTPKTILYLLEEILYKCPDTKHDDKKKIIKFREGTEEVYLYYLEPGNYLYSGGAPKLRVFLDPKQVKVCMDNYIETLNTYLVKLKNKQNHKDLQGKAGMLQIAWFYYAFVFIHPFIDGNGRSALIILNALLELNDRSPLLPDKYSVEDFLEAIHNVDDLKVEAFVNYIDQHTYEVSPTLHKNTSYIRLMEPLNTQRVHSKTIEVGGEKSKYLGDIFHQTQTLNQVTDMFMKASAQWIENGDTCEKMNSLDKKYPTINRPLKVYYDENDAMKYDVFEKLENELVDTLESCKKGRTRITENTILAFQKKVLEETMHKKSSLTPNLGYRDKNWFLNYRENGEPKIRPFTDFNKIPAYMNTYVGSMNNYLNAWERQSTNQTFINISNPLYMTWFYCGFMFIQPFRKGSARCALLTLNSLRTINGLPKIYPPTRGSIQQLFAASNEAVYKGNPRKFIEYLNRY